MMPQKAADDSDNNSFDAVVFSLECVASPNNNPRWSNNLDRFCITEQIFSQLLTTSQCTDGSLTPYPSSLQIVLHTCGNYNSEVFIV